MTSWYRQRRLLKYIIKYQEETSSCGPLVSELSILNDEKLPATIRRLVSRGLIVEEISVNSPHRVRTTPQGHCFFDVRHTEIQNLIMKSILIPILVSLATYCITSYLLPVKETSAPSSPALCTCTTPESIPPALVPEAAPISTSPTSRL